VDLMTPTVRIEQTSRSPHALGHAISTARSYSETLQRSLSTGLARAAGTPRSLIEHSVHTGSSQTTLLDSRGASFSIAPTSGLYPSSRLYSFSVVGILGCRKTSDGAWLAFRLCR